MLDGVDNCEEEFRHGSNHENHASICDRGSNKTGAELAINQRSHIDNVAEASIYHICFHVLRLKLNVILSIKLRGHELLFMGSVLTKMMVLGVVERP